MKKLISFALALSLVLSVAAVAGISVSAEDEYDYVSVFDADLNTYVYKTEKSAKHFVRLSSAEIVDVNFNRDNNSSKALKVTTENWYDRTGMIFSIGDDALVGSVGVRMWIAGDEASLLKNAVSLGFGADSIYGTGAEFVFNACQNKGSDTWAKDVTVDGCWIEVYWASDLIKKGTFPGQGPHYQYNAVVTIDDTMLKNAKSIAFGLGDQGNNNKNKNSVYYIDDIQIIKPHVTVTEPTITMDAGASMRIDNKTHGIRFSATVEKDVLDAYTAAGATVTEVGTLIAKKETSEDKIKIENAVASTEGNIAENPEVVVAKYANADMQAVEGANVYTIVGSLVELKPKNAEQGYVAKAYIKFKVGTETKVVYSNLSDARSIKEVATAVKADTTYYSSLCANHKAAVDKWL